MRKKRVISSVATRKNVSPSFQIELAFKFILALQLILRERKRNQQNQLRNVILHNSCFSVSNSWVVKPSRLMWAGHDVGFSEIFLIGLVYDPVVKMCDTENDDNGNG